MCDASASLPGEHEQVGPGDQQHPADAFGSLMSELSVPSSAAGHLMPSVKLANTLDRHGIPLLPLKDLIPAGEPAADSAVSQERWSKLALPGPTPREARSARIQQRELQRLGTELRHDGLLATSARLRRSAQAADAARRQAQTARGPMPARVTPAHEMVGAIAGQAQVCRVGVQLGALNQPVSGLSPAWDLRVSKSRLGASSSASSCSNSTCSSGDGSSDAGDVQICAGKMSKRQARRMAKIDRVHDIEQRSRFATRTDVPCPPSNGRRAASAYLQGLTHSQLAWRTAKWMAARGKAPSVRRMQDTEHRVREWFRLIDLDGNGRLSPVEVVEPLCSLGAARSALEVLAMIAAVKGWPPARLAALMAVARQSVAAAEPAAHSAQASTPQISAGPPGTAQQQVSTSAEDTLRNLVGTDSTAHMTSADSAAVHAANLPDAEIAFPDFVRLVTDAKLHNTAAEMMRVAAELESAVALRKTTSTLAGGAQSSAASIAALDEALSQDNHAAFARSADELPGHDTWQHGASQASLRLHQHNSQVSLTSRASERLGGEAVRGSVGDLQRQGRSLSHGTRRALFLATSGDERHFNRHGTSRTALSPSLQPDDHRASSVLVRRASAAGRRASASSAAMPLASSLHTHAANAAIAAAQRAVKAGNADARQRGERFVHMPLVSPLAELGEPAARVRRTSPRLKPAVGARGGGRAPSKARARAGRRRKRAARRRGGGAKHRLDRTRRSSSSSHSSSGAASAGSAEDIVQVLQRITSSAILQGQEQAGSGDERLVSSTMHGLIASQFITSRKLSSARQATLAAAARAGVEAARAFDQPVPPASGGPGSPVAGDSPRRIRHRPGSAFVDAPADRAAGPQTVQSVWQPFVDKHQSGKVNVAATMRAATDQRFEHLPFPLLVSTARRRSVLDAAMGNMPVQLSEASSAGNDTAGTQGRSRLLLSSVERVKARHALPSGVLAALAAARASVPANALAPPSS